MINLLGLEDESSIIELRPGEALNCEHSYESKGGCGTMKFCITCNAVNAILNSQRGREDSQECCIIQRHSGNNLDLRVWAKPIKIKDELFTIFVVNDISDEKRKLALERTFFHDILNSAGAIRGFMQVFNIAGPEIIDKYKGKLNVFSERLVEEIETQRDLIKAENKELSINFIPINSLELLNEIATLYSEHEVAKGKHILVDFSSESIDFVSDGTLIKRVIGNMVKNALEASDENQNVTICCNVKEDTIEFLVHNSKFMPTNVQHHVFERSYSTKGEGRGLGTYSMKMLSKNYLNGNVSFVTSEENGTTFKACYPINQK